MLQLEAYCRRKPTMKVLLSVILLPIFICVTASDQRITGRESRVRNVRQAVTCSNQDDCLPAALRNVTVPSDLVSCEGNACICRSCFQLQEGICMDQAPCWVYNSGTRACDDNRKSQLVAFLLSFFLSYVGAANFYIERGDLGGGQLAVFLVTFLFSYIAFIPCCFFCCCKDSEGGMACGAIIYIILIIIGFILITCASLIMMAWWIADLVVFVENTRNDGMGCPLSPTLSGSS